MIGYPVSKKAPEVILCPLIRIPLLFLVLDLLACLGPAVHKLVSGFACFGYIRCKGRTRI